MLPTETLKLFSSYLEALNYLLISSLQLKDLVHRNNPQALEALIDNRSKAIELALLNKKKIEQLLQQHHSLRDWPNYQQLQEDVIKLIQIIQYMDQNTITLLQKMKSGLQNQVSRFVQIKKYL
jgi:hypothetical protein